MCTVFTNQPTKPPTRNSPKRNRRGGACVPARTSAQRRFYTKYTRMVRGVFNDGCALVGRHGRAAPFPHQIYTHCAWGLNDGCAPAGRHGRAHRHRPYPSPRNHAVCPYPIGVILSKAQGWQVQRSLPWVTMQVRGLPPWGLYFFSSHIITTRGERMISRMQIDFKKYNADGIGSPLRFYPG